MNDRFSPGHPPDDDVEEATDEQAKNTAERSSWFVALEKKIEEAKAMKDQIQASEGYKKRIESYGKFASLMPS